MIYERVALRRLFRTVNGGTPTSDPSNWKGGVAWATPVDVGQSGQYLEATARTITEAGLREGARLVPMGSIILSTRAPIGHLSIAAIPVAFNQGCRGLVPIVDLDVRYFAYQLGALRPDLQAAGAGSTFAELSSDALASMRVFCPAVDQQRRIANFLDMETAKIDRLVAFRNAQIRLVVERTLARVFESVGGQQEASDRRDSGLRWLGQIHLDGPLWPLATSTKYCSGRC